MKHGRSWLQLQSSFRRSFCTAVPCQLAVHVLCNGPDRGIVKHQGAWQLEVQRCVEPVGELNRCQGVKAACRQLPILTCNPWLRQLLFCWYI